MQDMTDRPLAWGVGAREVPTVEREALQRLVPSPFKLLNEMREPSSRLRIALKLRRTLRVGTNAILPLENGAASQYEKM